MLTLGIPSTDPQRWRALGVAVFVLTVIVTWLGTIAFTLACWWFCWTHIAAMWARAGTSIALGISLVCLLLIPFDIRRALKSEDQPTDGAP